ncbi:MAG: hypothetical protein V1672_03925 [Candidatus Diapherotrites archaeon]
MIFEIIYNLLTLNLGFFIDLILSNLLWVFVFALLYKYYLGGNRIIGYIFLLFSWLAFGDLFSWLGWEWFPITFPLIYFVLLISYEIFSEGSFLDNYKTASGYVFFIGLSFAYFAFM